MTHDYKRNGTTTLFAVLNVLNGQVITQRQQRHRHTGWLQFLRQTRDAKGQEHCIWTAKANDTLQNRADRKLGLKKNEALP